MCVCVGGGGWGGVGGGGGGGVGGGGSMSAECIWIYYMFFVFASLRAFIYNSAATQRSHTFSSDYLPYGFSKCVSRVVTGWIQYS